MSKRKKNLWNRFSCFSGHNGRRGIHAVLNEGAFASGREDHRSRRKRTTRKRRRGRKEFED